MASQASLQDVLTNHPDMARRIAEAGTRILARRRFKSGCRKVRGRAKEIKSLALACAQIEGALPEDPRDGHGLAGFKSNNVGSVC